MEHPNYARYACIPSKTRKQAPYDRPAQASRCIFVCERVRSYLIAAFSFQVRIASANEDSGAFFTIVDAGR
jgi:hypothetical protein